jgi:hypothetical protein
MHRYQNDKDLKINSNIAPATIKRFAYRLFSHFAPDAKWDISRENTDIDLLFLPTNRRPTSDCRPPISFFPPLPRRRLLTRVLFLCYSFFWMIVSIR